MYTCLDLFSGTGSVKKICQQLGIKCISLDISDKYSKPDILVDILKWNYNKLKRGCFTFIFAGIPCTEYSAMQSINTTLYGTIPDIKGANKIAKKTLEIIEYFNPKYYFIENPATSTLRKQVFMKKLPFYIVSYCKYGFIYRKNTIVFTNLKGFQPKYCTNDCSVCKKNNGKHVTTIGGRSKLKLSLSQRYSYPPLLIKELFIHAMKHS